MVTLILSVSLGAVLLKTICVAKRVHRVLATGKGSRVRASRREDFPELWSPTTTSYLIL